MNDNTPEPSLFAEISALIEQARNAAVAQANHTATMLYWKIGNMINTAVLQEKRADYGKRIVSTLATQLQGKFGRTFELRNVRRMMQFADQFPNCEIVSPLATQLSWSHFIELLPLKAVEAKLFYAQVAAGQRLSAKALREQISRKAFERTAIADARLAPDSPVPQGTFKDPYLFDFLGLKNAYLESDLEAAILRELESFILEFGKGFTFVERQKRYDH
jgi:predicted nuclease of restriction endonuclease-like (RecB) superfamily